MRHDLGYEVPGTVQPRVVVIRCQVQFTHTSWLLGARYSSPTHRGYKEPGTVHPYVVVVSASYVATTHGSFEVQRYEQDICGRSWPGGVVFGAAQRASAFRSPERLFGAGTLQPLPMSRRTVPPVNRRLPGARMASMLATVPRTCVEIGDDAPWPDVERCEHIARTLPRIARHLPAILGPQRHAADHHRQWPRMLRDESSLTWILLTSSNLPLVGYYAKTRLGNGSRCVNLSSGICQERPLTLAVVPARRALRPR